MTEDLDRCNNIILLFRSPSEDGIDSYHKTLEDEGLTAASIPVLQFVFINLKDYCQKLSNINAYHSLVFTSQQAVRATQEVLETWTETQKRELTDNTVCFVVGKATGKAAKQLGFSVKGEEMGNASNLCDFLLSEISTSETRPVLFPCSNIRKDTIMERLSANRNKVDEIHVYETGHRQDIVKNVQSLIQSYGFPSALVFFSPSGVQAFLENRIADILDSSSKIVAIGPSTKTEMEKYGMKVFGIAAKPDPQSLLDVLKNRSC